MLVDASPERMQTEMPAGGPDGHHSQLQVGRWILQLGAPEGAELSPAADQPAARPRTEPVLLRPRPFPSLIGLETVVGC